MKYLLIVLVGFNFLINSCDSKYTRDIERNNVTKNDTIIVSNNVSDYVEYIEKEFYLVIKNDTSSLSCLTTFNKMDSTLNITINITSNGKYNPNDKDTNAIRMKQEDMRLHYYHNNLYLNQLNELKMIFDKISNIYNLSKIKKIKFYLSDFNEFSSIITKEFIEKKKKNKTINKYELLDTLLIHSILVSDLNKYFNKFSRKIDKINSSDKFFFQKNNVHESDFGKIDDTTYNRNSEIINVEVSVNFK